MARPRGRCYLVRVMLEPPMPKKRVLLILDNPDVASSLRAALASDRYDLEVAASAAGVVRRLLHGSWDVLVTNPSSSIAEDIELVRYLQRVQPGIKAIILAPETAPEEVILALRTHAFACYREPFDVGEIAQMVRRAAAEDSWRDGISVVSGHPNWISLRVTPRRLTAQRVVAFVKAMLHESAEGERDSLATAFGEILQNAVEHGAGFDPEKVVEVSAIRTAKALVFHFRDPGPGFDMDDLPHAAVSNPPDDPIAHVDVRSARGMRPGGFGILMAKKLVDELQYNEAGNEVILIRHLRPVPRR